MAAKISFYDDTWFNQIAYNKSIENDAETNTQFISKLKQLLALAIEEELTFKQKEILKMYYYEKISMPQIAQKYSLNKSTICRHIKNAKRKIKSVMKYVMMLKNIGL